MFVIYMVFKLQPIDGLRGFLNAGRDVADQPPPQAWRPTILVTTGSPYPKTMSLTPGLTRLPWAQPSLIFSSASRLRNRNSKPGYILQCPACAFQVRWTRRDFLCTQ